MPECVEPYHTLKIKGHGQLYSCSCIDQLADFSFELPGVIRGHHVYKSTWTSSIEEILPIQADTENEHDVYVVGH